MEETIYTFSDGSYYAIRADKIGDTIFGKIAHNIMYAMWRAFNYQNPSREEKIQFIENYPADQK